MLNLFRKSCCAITFQSTWDCNVFNIFNTVCPSVIHRNKIMVITYTCTTLASNILLTADMTAFPVLLNPIEPVSRLFEL